LIRAFINQTTAIIASVLRIEKSISLFVAELAIVLGLVLTVALVLIIPTTTFHFTKLIVTFYTNGTTDFSTDASSLVRGLGLISLLTLTFGVTMGGAITITVAKASHTRRKLEYESALAAAGLVNVTIKPDGTTYELTELGHRFLKEYAFLNQKILSRGGVCANSPTLLPEQN
jgi:hypothetical protein